MRVLSLDIDVFVEPVAHMQSLYGHRRLNKRSYSLDPENRIRDVLSRCGLHGDPIRGVFMRHHDDAFSVLAALNREHGPVDLLHVDAHADLGMGDGSHVHLITEIAHRRVEDRATPNRGLDGLNAGSWLAFATACGWISTICHVRREVPANDLAPLLFSDWPTRKERSCELGIFPMTDAELDSLVDDITWESRWPTIVARGPAATRAAFSAVSLDALPQQKRPDFVIVCQSPAFTVAAADSVLDVCRPAIAIDNAIQGLVTAPQGFPAEERRSSKKPRKRGRKVA